MPAAVYFQGIFAGTVEGQTWFMVYLQGIFMKHLQYYLDQTGGDAARVAKYAGFISAQSSGVYHYATGSSGVKFLIQLSGFVLSASPTSNLGTSGMQGVRAARTSQHEL